jgi:hypothetical protein
VPPSPTSFLPSHLLALHQEGEMDRSSAYFPLNFAHSNTFF